LAAVQFAGCEIETDAAESNNLFLGCRCPRGRHGGAPPQYGMDAGVFLAFFVSVLHFFNIDPELRARGLR
jgi:hypothetical protein